MKNILLCLAINLVLLTLAACGGGGDNSATGQNQQIMSKTTATLTINITGVLPASTAISGTAFTLTLPTSITPATTNGVVATGVVSDSGTFVGSTLAPQVAYTAATASAPGMLKITLANSMPAGVTQVGEVATITLQLANGVAPTIGSFGLSSVNVIDTTLYAPITGMNVVISNVSLQ